MTVEVYRRPNGDYAVPDITDSLQLAARNILNIISLAAGAVLMTAGAVFLAGSVRKIRELESKIRPDEGDNAQDDSRK